MKQRRAGFALVVLAVCAASVALFAQGKDDKKKDEAQKREIQAIVKSVDDLTAGQPAANDLSMTWVREDVLKAQGNKEYVPFTVQIDASKVSGGTVAFYWRVVSKGTAAAVPEPGKKDDKKDKDKGKKSDYAYEDISFIPVTAGQSSMKISRSFTVPAGNYDVFLIAKEPTPEKAPKNAPAQKLSALKQTVNVPDYWSNELATSSVIVAQRIDPLPAPLTPQQQADRPYALGMMEIVPTFETKFTKKAELSTFMLIYKPKVDSTNKPDVSVEYNFYQKLAGQPEKFFNKTNPQNLNGQTLPPNFDFAAGHQLQSGQAVPLASFPEGDYRLEIKITDKIANKTLTREVVFTVIPS
ncbi:MAG TPA: hypothetical protein VHT95_06385 [Vicinamibacterales bacterium]|nr:hypothetical protein [Vicinamibacterales bacterium]